MVAGWGGEKIRERLWEYRWRDVDTGGGINFEISYV